MDTKGFFITVIAEKETVNELQSVLDKKYNLSTFSVPEESIDFLSKNPCNLLIIEINADTFNGFDIKKEAKKISFSSNLIFISKKRDLNTVVSSQKHGADYLFFLPFEKEKVNDALSILRKRRDYWMELMRSLSGGKK